MGVVRGVATAWRAALGYCAAMVLWTVAKLVFWHETEAVVFGLAAVVVASLLVTPAARRHVTDDGPR